MSRYDESKHPRKRAGDPAGGGGRFAPKENAAPAGDVTLADEGPAGDTGTNGGVDVTPRRERLNRTILDNLQSSKDGYQYAADRFAASLTSKNGPDAGAYEGLIVAQAKRDAWAPMERILANRAGVDPLDAGDLMVAEYTRDIIQRSRALSRSTSVVSNLLEDAQREARARFCHDWEWNRL